MGVWKDDAKRKAYYRDYHAKHRDEISTKRRKRRRERLEEFRQRDLAYAAMHREEAKARAKAWYCANPERAKASRKRWNVINKASKSAKAKKSRADNQTKHRAYERGRAVSKSVYNREYTKRNPEKNRRNQHRRRVAMSNAPFDKTITTGGVYARDGGICGLCNKPVPAQAATIDHIVPVSKGGGHIWENVHIAHKSCNSFKSNKTDVVIYSL